MVADFDNEEPQRGKDGKAEGRRRYAAAPAEELAESLVNSLGWQSPPSLRDICR